jgi:hypothetical protein
MVLGAGALADCWASRGVARNRRIRARERLSNGKLLKIKVRDLKQEYTESTRAIGFYLRAQRA